jgi:hypothetical protein
MPRGVKKENLPSKVCETCQRPFTWRKVWEACWDEVKCCSDRCKGERKRKQQEQRRASRQAEVGSEGQQQQPEQQQQQQAGQP